MQPPGAKPGTKSPLMMRCSVNRTHLKPKLGTSLFVAIDLKPTPRPEQNRRNISLAIDSSGSMDGEKMDQARQSALGLIKQLRPTDLISVLSFSDSVDLKLPTAPVGNRAAAEAAVKAISVRGLTAMYEGLEQASKQVGQSARDANTVNRVFLVTDGNPTVGRTDDADFVRLAQTMREMRITLTTIGIGNDYSETLLHKIADAGGGLWHHIRDPKKDLPQIFTEQAVQMASTVVTNPVLKIAIMPGAELADAYTVKPALTRLPRPNVVNGAFSIPLKDLIVGQEQTLVFRIGVSAKPAGATKLMRAAIEDVVQDVNITFTDDAKLTNAEANPYPRMLLSSAEATVLIQKAVQNKEAAALQKAETIMKTIATDPGAMAAARSNPVLSEVVTTMRDAQATVARSGLQMNESAKKDFLHETTVIGKKKPGK